MNTRHYRRISRKAADQLLDGAAGPDQGFLTGPTGSTGPAGTTGSGQLASVLAAAAAPGHADELAGEQMAVAAFEANHLASVADSRSEQMIKSPLAKILTVKVIAAALAVGAGGGVALAASTGTFSGSSPATSRTNVATPATPVPGWTSQAATPSDSPSPSASASSAPAGTGPQQTASASASASPSPASIPQTAAGLCRALAGTVLTTTGTGTAGSLTKTAQEQALASGAVSGVLKNNSEFSSLVSTAQSALNVPDYCALLLQLPGLPAPADLVNLPVSLLSTLLAQLPVATLAQDLTSLPSSTLSTLLTELPVATVSQLLTSLPGSVLTQLFTALPASTATQVLNELPTSAVSQLVTELPSSLLSGLSGLSGSVLGLLPGR